MFYYVVFREAKGGKAVVQRLVVTSDLEADLDAHFTALYAEWEGAQRRPVEFDRDWVLKESEEVWACPFAFPAPYDGVLTQPTRYPAYQPPHNPKAMSLRAILAADQTHTRLLFQYCNQAHTLERRGMIAMVFDKATFTKLKQPGLSVANALCAVVSDGSLEFTRPSTVCQFIDLKLESYGEATLAEIQSVLTNEAVFKGDIDAAALDKMCDKTTRKHFQKVLKDGVMGHANMTGEKLAKLAEEAELDLEVVGRKGHRRIVLPTDKTKLKKLVVLLNQKIFRSAITDDFCETNSYRKLKKPVT